MTYPNTQLFINGQWCDAAAGESLAVFNPATGKEIGRVAHARIPDLDRALQAAQKGFETWRDMLPVERNKIMRKAAALMRERAADIAAMLTQEQGKPLMEAKGEAMIAADLIEWFADEGMRVYGRIVPSRFNLSVRQMVIKDPVGPVAAFTPWNFPINQVVRKMAAALASGCSMMSKHPKKLLPRLQRLFVLLQTQVCQRAFWAWSMARQLRFLTTSYRTPSSARSPSRVQHLLASNWLHWRVST